MLEGLRGFCLWVCVASFLIWFCFLPCFEGLSGGRKGEGEFVKEGWWVGWYFGLGEGNMNVPRADGSGEDGMSSVKKKGKIKRVANGSLLVKAGRNVGKMALTYLVFSYEILVESVEYLVESGSVVVVFERGDTLLTTKPFKVVAGRADVGETLCKEVTLYRRKDGKDQEGEFQDKLYKVALRLNHANGKTLGKMRVDLSQYADAEKEGRRLSFKLSNGASVVVTLSSQLVQNESKSNRSRVRNGDSETQSITDSYVSSSDIDGDSFGDLDLQFERDIELESTSE